ncbi:MAG: hypothetical protein ACFNND_06915 [Streptococcus sobrinus]
MFNFLKDYRKESTKLNIVVAANWLIKIINEMLFRIISIFGVGIILSQAFHVWLPLKFVKELAEALINYSPIAMLFFLTFYFIKGIVRSESSTKDVFPRFFWRMVEYLIIGASLQYSPSFGAVSYCIFIWLIMGCIYFLTKNIRSQFFDYYLFKNVLDKDYLGVRKVTDSNVPEVNIFKDSEIENINDRLNVISSRSIKNRYRGVVECSFLIKEERTRIYSGYEFPSHKKFRRFEKDDLILKPVFYVYPFGKDRFDYRLSELLLSENQAFTTQGTGLLKASTQETKIESETKNYGNEKSK